MILYRSSGITRAETVPPPASNPSIGNFLSGKRFFQLKFIGLFTLQTSITPSKAVRQWEICSARCFQTVRWHPNFHVVKRSVLIFLPLALLLIYRLSCCPKLSQQMGMYFSLMKVLTPTFNPNNWTFTSAFGRAVRCPAIFIHLNSWDMLMQTAYMKSSLTVVPLLVSKVCFRFQWMAPM